MDTGAAGAALKATGIVAHAVCCILDTAFLSCHNIIRLAVMEEEVQVERPFID